MRFEDIESDPSYQEYLGRTPQYKSKAQSKPEGFLEDFKKAFRGEYGVGSGDASKVMFRAREIQGKPSESTQFRQMVQSYRTAQAVKAALGVDLDTAYEAARQELSRENPGIAFDVSTPGKRLGTVAGSLASDLTQDRLRNFWWLLNAYQAVGNIAVEEALYRGMGAEPGDVQQEMGLGGEYERKRPFVSEMYSTVPDPTDAYDPKKPRATRPKYIPGNRDALRIPTGIAINTGLGLMSPFGGAEGYKAVLPSEDDPTKTSNVIGEVAIKYLLGQTGNLLPYDEFVKVRPDVSKDEYQRYKAFKFDKKEDYNPFDDGKLGIGMGAIKFTDEGIHGPELQFLGRSLPVTTGFIPTIGAIGGTVAGVRSGGRGAAADKNRIRRGLIGGFGGLAAGNIVGNLVEGERRRRNAAENELDTL